MIGAMHPVVEDLIAVGKRRGWLSYEELNNVIPDEYVEMMSVHGLVTIFDKEGIELVDEMEFRGRLFRAQRSGDIRTVEAIGFLTDQFRAMSVTGGENLGDGESIRIKLKRIPLCKWHGGDGCQANRTSRTRCRRGTRYGRTNRPA